MSKARKSDKYQRVYLNGDSLKINGRDYTVDDLGVLPKDLHPNNFAVKENDNWIILAVFIAHTCSCQTTMKLQSHIITLYLLMSSGLFSMQKQKHSKIQTVLRKSCAPPLKCCKTHRKQCEKLQHE